MTDDGTHEVYTLVVEVGRGPDDGLPDGATGAALLCYTAAADEEEAVRDTVELLKQAGLAPIEVTGYGTRADREADGEDIDAESAALMARARAEGAVIVAQITPFDD